MEYEILTEGERLQAGDEIRVRGVWEEICGALIGETIHHAGIYRRPKVTDINQDAQ